MGSLEAWLLLRSLRTHHLRIPRQSETATALAQWLAKIAATPKGQTFDGVPGGTLDTVWHSSLQEKDTQGWLPSEQMEGGYNATFAMTVNGACSLCEFIVNNFPPACGPEACCLLSSCPQVLRRTSSVRLCSMAGG